MVPDYISYQLLLWIKEELEIQIGKLGYFVFPPGYYVYTGSASKNMEARIKRHLKKKKPLHWHVDYLTTHPLIQVNAVHLSGLDECLLNQKQRGQILIPGFGASDCRNACQSHLKYIGHTMKMWKG